MELERKHHFALVLYIVHSSWGVEKRRYGSDSCISRKICKGMTRLKVYESNSQQLKLRVACE